MEEDEAGVGAHVGKEILNYIEGARYLIIERCVQCPNYALSDKFDGHECLKMDKPTGECSDPIPDWCPLPLLEDK